MYPKALWCLKMCLDSWPWHIMSAVNELGLGSGKSRQAWGLVAFGWLNTCTCYDSMAKLWHRLTGQNNSDPHTQWWFFSPLITIVLQQVRETFHEQVCEMHSVPSIMCFVLHIISLPVFRCQQPNFLWWIPFSFCSSGSVYLFAQTMSDTGTGLKPANHNSQPHPQTWSLRGNYPLGQSD